MTLDRWAHEREVVTDYSRPGKPTDNPFIESFKGSFRDECLNTHGFLSLGNTRQKIENSFGASRSAGRPQEYRFIFHYENQSDENA